MYNLLNAIKILKEREDSMKDGVRITFKERRCELQQDKSEGRVDKRISRTS